MPSNKLSWVPVSRRSVARWASARQPSTVWKKRYGGVGRSELRRLRQLEEENRKLKQIVADLSLDKAMSQAVVAKEL